MKLSKLKKIADLQSLNKVPKNFMMHCDKCNETVRGKISFGIPDVFTCPGCGTGYHAEQNSDTIFIFKRPQALSAILKHFGIKAQIGQLKEECQELIEAIDSGVDKDIKEEIADVKLVIDQLLDADIDAVYKDKVSRTLNRISTGFCESKEVN